MSEFSNVASYYVSQKNIKVASMIQYCDMDRSTMYKILSGKRNPPSLQLAVKMAEFMELTPLERNELLEAYKVTVMGSNLYYRRKNIINFFSNYPGKEIRTDLAAPLPLPLTEFPGTDTDFPVEGKSNIQRILYQMILKESSQSGGLIYIIAQPSWSYLLNLLQVLGHKKDRLEVRHIICMSNNMDANYKYKDYNISYLQQIMPLFQTDIRYKPRYYYDNIDSHFCNLNVLPYWVITSEYALSCSFDIQYAILYKNPGTVSMLKGIFQQQYQKTSVLFNILPDAGSDFFSLMKNGYVPDQAYVLNAWPCIIPALTKDLCETCLPPDTPNRSRLADSLAQYSYYVKGLYQKGLIKEFFTKKGLASFMETGKNKDIPESLYAPIEASGRKKILQSIIESVELGRSCLLKGEMAVIPLNIGCRVSSKGCLLTTTDSEGSFIHLVLEEKNICDSFLDCLANLDSMEVVAGKDEALEYLRGVLRKY